MVLAASWCEAQTLRVVGNTELATCITESTHPQPDSAALACIVAARQAGYLEASLDRQAVQGDTLLLVVHRGPLYRLGELTNRADTSAVYGQVGQDTLVAPATLPELVHSAQAYLEAQDRQGYPFARVSFDSLVAAGDTLNARSTTWSGPRVVYGGVRWVDDTDAPIKASYLERVLRVERGRTYRSSDLAQLERRLRGISFLKVSRPPVVVFEGPTAWLYVDAEVRQTSRFDFLLGFLPNSPANDGQLLLTGDVTLELENALRRGERLYFNFERLQPEATEVQLEGSYPYILESPFGARGSFNLYRQQDDWLRLVYEAGGSYSLGGADAIELFYTGGQAQALGFDTLEVLTQQQLPAVLDASRNGFGVRLQLDRRDDVFDTRSGWRLRTDASAALRRVSVPRGVRDLGEPFGMLADSIEGQTAQYRASLDVARYVSLGRRGAALLQFRGASVLGDQLPLRNELYRIGGNRLLRGFDEQTIDAQHYGVATLEYRLLIGGGSYLFAFADQGIVVDPYRSGRDVDQPTGFGAGLRLGTGGGALSLTYAYGRRNDLPIDWQRAKVHIGFASRF